MRSGAFKNLCHIQIYTVKWTYEPIWESIFSVFWASGVLKSIFPDLSAPKEARETKKIHLKFFIQKGLPPTWETTVLHRGSCRGKDTCQLTARLYLSMRCEWILEMLTNYFSPSSFTPLAAATTSYSTEGTARIKTVTCLGQNNSLIRWEGCDRQEC